MESKYPKTKICILCKKELPVNRKFWLHPRSSKDQVCLKCKKTSRYRERYHQ